VETFVILRLIKQDTDFYWQEIEKLVPRYDKYISCGGGNFGKQRIQNMCVSQIYFVIDTRIHDSFLSWIWKARDNLAKPSH
jgi:hypothetical protein